MNWIVLGVGLLLAVATSLMLWAVDRRSVRARQVLDRDGHTTTGTVVSVSLLNGVRTARLAMDDDRTAVVPVHGARLTVGQQVAVRRADDGGRLVAELIDDPIAALGPWESGGAGLMIALLTLILAGLVA